MGVMRRLLWVSAKSLQAAVSAGQGMLSAPAVQAQPAWCFTGYRVSGYSGVQIRVLSSAADRGAERGRLRGQQHALRRLERAQDRLQRRCAPGRGRRHQVQLLQRHCR